MLIVTISASPLCEFYGHIGFLIWILFYIITFGIASIIDRFKKIMIFKLIKKFFLLLMGSN